MAATLPPAAGPADASERLHALDAVRGFALLTGVVLHAAMSFLPGFALTGWPIVDDSPSAALGVTFFVIHMFRMTTFFVIAGFFGRMLLHRVGPRAFIRNRSTRVVLPLIVGWGVLFPLTVAAFVFAVSTAAEPARAAITPPAPPALAFPLTHLWFLYVLVWLYAGMLAVRSIAGRVAAAALLREPIDRIVRLLVSSTLAVPVLAVPVWVALASSPQWARWFGIPTPDQSLIPNLPATVAFVTAFGFGWVLQRQPALLNVIARHRSAYLTVAVLTTIVCLRLVGAAPEFSPVPPSRETWIYAACYAVGTWSWTFAVIGIAQRYLHGASAVRRYVADASYWVYLLHLPLVFFLQAVARSWPIHWSVKFTLIVGVSLALLFASYHLFVRFTVIGEILNGRRHPRRPAAPEPARPLSPADLARAPLAELTGVRKRFGATVALDDLSLVVKPGELLAVLGPNGAGKSTAISLLLGLQRPDQGSATLFGTSPHLVAARQRVGVMMQEAALSPELRVHELIALTASYYPAPMAVDDVLALTNTASLARTPYARLSGGQKRQAQFALAVCGNPALIFLDEPTVGLDVEARENLWAVLRRLVARGVSIVLTTHYLEEAEALAHRVVVLARGRAIAEGSVAQMRALVARKRIRCVTRVSADDVAAWPGVSGAAIDGAALQIIATDADAIVRRLLAEDAGAHDLEVQRASLADAFSELTREPEGVRA